MIWSPDSQKNRVHWNLTSDMYQASHGPQIEKVGDAWGIWQLPEDELRVLGEISGKDVLELGCGAAQWSISLAKRGAKPVGLDLSEGQLAHARRAQTAAGMDFPLIHADAECLPIVDESFDAIFCDHGAFSFVDPNRILPEAFRLLRPRGLLVFNLTSPFGKCCFDERLDQVDRELHVDYFDHERLEDADAVEFNLTYGDWIRAFRRYGFVVEDLIELRPPEGGATTWDYVPIEWARRWPAENIWKVRKSN